MLFLSGGKMESIPFPWITRPLPGIKTARSFFELWSGPIYSERKPTFKFSVRVICHWSWPKKSKPFTVTKRSAFPTAMDEDATRPAKKSDSAFVEVHTTSLGAHTGHGPCDPSNVKLPNDRRK